MSYPSPTVDDFKDNFLRDFPFAVAVGGKEGDPTDLKRVLDRDIIKALLLAGANINVGLFESKEIFQQAFMFLAAHHLVTNIRASSQGLNGSFNWLTTSKNAGDVGESFEVPDRIKNSPYFSAITKTYYGMQYLMIVWPRLIGNVGTVAGATHPL